MNCNVFKRTSDDWYPAYELTRWHEGAECEKLVEVSFHQTGPNPPADGEWIVCAWGADDCGMEKNFDDEAKAWCCFLEVIGLDDVTMNSLKERGFTGA